MARVWEGESGQTVLTGQAGLPGLPQFGAISSLKVLLPSLQPQALYLGRGPEGTRLGKSAQLSIWEQALDYRHQYLC